MNKENCALNLVDEIILYHDARSQKHQICQCCNVKVKFTCYEVPERVYIYNSTLSLNSALHWGVGGQNHAPAALPSGKRSGFLCTRGCVGPTGVLDGWRKSCLHRD